jgi:hypothetical protein
MQSFVFACFTPKSVGKPVLHGRVALVELTLLPALPPKLGVKQAKGLTMFHLQTPKLGSSQAWLMNPGNIELHGVKK